MTALAIERLPDPLVTPLLDLLKDAVNADMVEVMTDAGLTPEDVVAATKPFPCDARQLSEQELPALICYRIRSQTQRRTFGHLDHLVTLRLQYVTRATAMDRLDERWPILDQVWRKAFDALCAGHHEAHQDDAAVLVDAGVVYVNEAATKAEGYLPGGDLSFPQWEADVQVSWRDLSKNDTSELYPVLSMRTRITQALDGDPREPAGDVVLTAYTPVGVEELDSEPFEDEAELGGST